MSGIAPLSGTKKPFTEDEVQERIREASNRKLPRFTGHDNRATPRELYDLLNSDFDFDPCPLGGEKSFDGLSVDWGNRNYVNPPYSNVRPWIEKALKGKLCVLLLKVDTSKRVFHDLILPNASEIRFLKGRIKFTGKPAPFPSMLVVL